MKKALQQHRQYLLTGVSYVIPMIACGGILIATAIALLTMLYPNSMTPTGGPDFSVAPTLKVILDIGDAAFKMAMPVLGGFIAYAMGVVMLEVVGAPIADFMRFLGAWLNTMNQGNAIVLAGILGAMIAFDMGGPVNKAAFFFGAAMIKEGNYGVMGACAAAICTPPLGLALATLVSQKLWSEEQRESGLAALGMGMVGITEGAIPFAAADPFRVIPSIMFGSMVASSIAMLGGVGDHAPHGGPIVLPVVDQRLTYVLAIVVGTVVTAVTINFVKRLTEKPLARAEGGAQ
jgi:fructose-specific phosphotransferase system IIC component